MLDNRYHYLSCDQLPTVAEINTVVQAHRDVVEKIIIEVGSRYRDTQIIPKWGENIVTEGDTSYIGFSWGGASNCQGDRADIEITYPAHQDRELIEKIINGETFFGIPYQLINI